MSHLLRRTVIVPTLSGRGGLIARSGRSLMVSSSASYSGAAASTARRWINIGVIAAASAGLAYAVKESEVVEAAGVENGGINSKAFTPLTLKDRKHVTHNTDLFIFALKDKDAHLNLPVSSYIVTKYKGEDGKDVIRPYTPINHNEPGELHLLVKTYPRGLMSKHIHQLKVGDQLEIKGPLPKFDYHANQKKDVAFVVGGTGITPCLQVLEAILENPQDKTNVSIVFANTSTADILLKDRIDAAAASRKNVKVTYVIDKPEPGFHGETGYLNAEMLKKYLPKPSKDTMVFACGPPPFMSAVSGPKTPDYKQGEVTGALKELGFDSSNVFKF